MNDALRHGLGARGKPTRLPRFRVKPHAFAFKAEVDTDRLNQLVDELGSPIMEQPAALRESRP